MPGTERPRIGTSACLLGQQVRYNGDHKRVGWLTDVLAPRAELIGVCPEMEMGLGTPRESLRLTSDPRGRETRMIGNSSERDYTALAESTARRLIAGLPPLDGFILKKDSPSCGAERVRLYRPNGVPGRDGRGIFADALIRAFPALPVIEEGRLSDPEQRGRFLERVFAACRTRKLERTSAALQALHRSYKMVLMAHSPEAYRELGRIAALASRKSIGADIALYRERLVAALNVPIRRGRMVNAVEHVYSHLKERLNASEKEQFFGALKRYADGALSLEALLTLVNHLIQIHSVQYMKEQRLLAPYPPELGRTAPSPAGW